MRSSPAEPESAERIDALARAVGICRKNTNDIKISLILENHRLPLEYVLNSAASLDCLRKIRLRPTIDDDAEHKILLIQAAIRLTDGKIRTLTRIIIAVRITAVDARRTRIARQNLPRRMTFFPLAEANLIRRK